MTTFVLADASPEFWAALAAFLVAFANMIRQWHTPAAAAHAADKVDGLNEALSRRVAQLEATISASGVPPPASVLEDRRPK